MQKQIPLIYIYDSIVDQSYIYRRILKAFPDRLLIQTLSHTVYHQSDLVQPA